MKLRTLKPRLQTVSTVRVQMVTRPDIVERKRGRAGVRDRERIRERDGGLCQECKRNGKESLGEPVDHIRPLWAQGADEDWNKELLCPRHHDAKSLHEAGQRARGEAWSLLWRADGTA